MKRDFKLSVAGGGGNFFYGLLALLLAAGVAYVYWRYARAGSPDGGARATAPSAPPVAKSRPAPGRITPLPPRADTASATGLNLRAPNDLLEVQVALARQAICPGSIDGTMGSQTRAALRAFQRLAGLPVTGNWDAATRGRLSLAPPVLTNREITAADLARLQPLSFSWLGKSQQSALDYESALELVAEKSHAHPALIRQLNPGISWASLAAGTTVLAPLVAYPPPRAKAALVEIHLSEKALEAYDAATNLLAHFPCSIAARVEKRPVGELRVTVIVPDPNYTFDPEIFPESAEGRELGRKLVLPPGPNNPVGVAWIGLDRPGYGIHGTPRPEEVGRTESHGCFRLANWNAEYLARLVSVGTRVVVLP